MACVYNNGILKNGSLKDASKVMVQWGGTELKEGVKPRCCKGKKYQSEGQSLKKVSIPHIKETEEDFVLR